MEPGGYYSHRESTLATRLACLRPALVIAFAAGITACQFVPRLPAPHWAWLLPICLLGLWGIRRPRVQVLLALSCGFLWAVVHAAWTLGHELAPDLQGRDLRVSGVVASLPVKKEHGLRFEFDVERLEANGRAWPSPGRVRLNWYRAWPELRAGQRWELMVRLSRPHGLMNPGGFDYEAWLFERGIRATGYVRDPQDSRLLGEASGLDYRLDRWRQRLAETLASALHGRPQVGLITALVLGERGGIDRAQWQRFTRTGTNHLVAISGLHVGIVAGLVFFLARGLWARAGRLPLRYPAPRAAALAALLAAVGYAALAGFAVPTQRALAMLGVVLGGLLLHRAPSPGHTLALALLLVLLIDPLAVLSAGFWLSFLAVAVILYAMAGRIRRRGSWRDWGRVQWVVGIGLFPVLLAVFHQASLIAPLVNLVAVPWFTLVIVPLSLLGTLLAAAFPEPGRLLLATDDSLLHWTMEILGRLADLPMAVWPQAAMPLWVWGVALPGVALLLAPRGIPGRWTGMLMLFPLFSLPAPRPVVGEIWFTLLDVGQGLAAVVQTHEHTLLCDAGARFPGGLDAGEAVVLPFLRQAGITRLDMMLLSNADNDHAGGGPAVAGQLEVARLISGEPGQLGWSHAEACRAGMAWEWDGVGFEILHPPGPGWQGNDASCVLRVSGPGGVLLLSGDIEARAERRLLEFDPAQLKADILVVPHHGSRTSSNPGLVAAVGPRYALFAVGHRNRYGFPAAEIAVRWRDHGARLLDTAAAGAIRFNLKPGTGIAAPELYRELHRRYWRDG